MLKTYTTPWSKGFMKIMADLQLAWKIKGIPELKWEPCVGAKGTTDECTGHAGSFSAGNLL